MKLSDLIRESLDGQKILGKDKKEYLIQVTWGGQFSICVKDTENPLNYGVFPEIGDLGTVLYNYEMTDFTSVNGRGLYKKVIQMISEAVPVGTSYRGSMVNYEDQQGILSYVRDNKHDLNIKEALERTRFGHVLLSSKFKDVKILYKGLTNPSEGINALLNFSRDIEKGVFTSSHGTDLYLIGTKC